MTTAKDVDFRSIAVNVRDIRTRHERGKADLARLRDVFQDEHAQLIEDVRRDGIEREAAEAILRAAALDAYDEDKNNLHPGPGVSVNMTTEVTFDKALAQQWALDHRVLLNLDTKAFEQVARSKGSMIPESIAQVNRKVPKAVIATDLVKALE